MAMQMFYSKVSLILLLVGNKLLCCPFASCNIPFASSFNSTDIPYQEFTLDINCTMATSLSAKYQRSNRSTTEDHNPNVYITVGLTDNLYFEDENKWIHRRLGCNFMPNQNGTGHKFCLSHISDGLTIGQCINRAETCSMEWSPNFTDHGHLIRPTECEVNTINSKWYKNPAMIIACIVFFVQTLIAVAATLYDFLLRDKSDPDDYLAPHNIFLCWSLRKNFNKIFDSPQGEKTIEPIVGLKVISMVWLLVGGSYVSAIPFVDDSSKFLNDVTKPWYMQIVTNYTLAMDIFFLCVGMSISHNFFTAEREKMDEATDTNQSDTEVFKDIATLLRHLCRHRFIRLWPSILWMFMIILGLKSMYPKHPLLAIIDPWDQCKTTFWINLLFLNTIFPTRCMRFTWYFANDFIYYIITTPFVLLVMYIRYVLGLISAIILIVVSMVSILGVNLYYQFPPSIFPLSESDASPETYHNHETQIYIRPFSHYTPYLIGTIFGYTLAQPRLDDPFLNIGQEQNSKYMLHLSWFASVGAGCWAIFGSYPALSGLVPPEWMWSYNMTYKIFSQPVFCLSIAWQIYACHTKEAPVLNAILSTSVWEPFGNMAYSILIVYYLMILGVFYYLPHFPIVWNGPLTLFPYILIQMVLTLLVSIPIYFCITIPPSSIETIYLEDKPPPPMVYEATAEGDSKGVMGAGISMVGAGVSATVSPIVDTFSMLKRRTMSSRTAGRVLQVFCSLKGLITMVFIIAVAIIVFSNVI